MNESQNGQLSPSDSGSEPPIQNVSDNLAISGAPCCGVMEISETEAVQRTSSLDATADASKASSSLSDSDLMDSGTAKTPSLEMVRSCLGRLSLLFPMNVPLDKNLLDIQFDRLSRVYRNLLYGYSDEDVGKACMECARTLTRFPYPADIINAIEGEKK